MKTEQSQIHAFLSDLIRICKEHDVEEIYCRIEKDMRPTTVFRFTDNSFFEDLEFALDESGATVWWPEAEIVLGR